MNALLWTLAGLLALAFAAAGSTKLATSKEKSQGRMPWVEDFSTGTIKLIGGLEVLGAIGLILPPLVKVAAVLAPVAATGLAITMVGAALTHARRKEWSNLAVNGTLFVLAVVVAWGRFGPHKF